MTRTLEQINTELNKLIADNQKEIQKVEADLAAIDPTIKKAKQDIIKAKKDINAEAYDTAKRELWTAENTKEMLADKLTELRHRPIVTKEKYRELYFEICSVGNRKVDEVFEKISQVFPELERVSDEHQDTVGKIYENLEMLYGSIGRGADELQKDDNGRIDSSFHGGLSYTPKKDAGSFLKEFTDRYKEIVK